MRAAGEVPHCRGTASIPAGTFLMGCHEGDGAFLTGCHEREECNPDEHPAHKVTVSAFQVDRCDFTERQMEELKKRWPGTFDDIHTTCDIDRARVAWNWIKWKFGFATGSGAESCDKPLVGITWMQADAICRARGMRLLTEAEYEYLARGPSGNDAYGTAGGEQPTENNARFKSDDRADVGTYAPKMWGSEAVYDLAGNAWKWVADWDGPYSAEAAHDPQGPKEGRRKGARGGSYGSPDDGQLRSPARGHLIPAGSNLNLGVRCAAPLDCKK